MIEFKTEFHEFDADLILTSLSNEQPTTESVSAPVPEPGTETVHLLPSAASTLPNKLQHHFWCKNCLRSFKSKLKLEKHLKGLLYSKACYGLVSSPKNRPRYGKHNNASKYHRLLAPPTYTCTECETKFHDKTLLEAHLSKHIVEKNANNAERDPLSLTDADDTDLKPAHQNFKLSLFGVTFECRAVHCSQKFLSPELLESHEKLHRKKNVVGVLWKCSRCPRLRSFTVQHDFRRHLLLHSDENVTPFKCSECSIYFPKRFSLTRHLENHLGEDPDDEGPPSKKAKMEDNSDSNSDSITSIQAPNYSKSLNENEYDRDPSIITEGEVVDCEEEPMQLRPKKMQKVAETDIPICEPSKKQESRVEAKTPMCSFTCNVCLKTFSRASSFKRHITHQDVNVTYKCSACPHLTFCFKFNLKEHMKTNHVGTNTSNNPRNYKYDCKNCQKFFRYEIGLQVHMQEYHKGQGEKDPTIIKQEAQPDQEEHLPEPELPASVLPSEPESIKVEIKVEAVHDIQIKLDPDLFL